MRLKKITSASPKQIGVPKTSEEKYNKLKEINPAIEKLRGVFGLDVEL